MSFMRYISSNFFLDELHNALDYFTRLVKRVI